MSWQSSNTPRTADVEDVRVLQRIHLRRLEGALRPCGESMKTFTLFFPRSAYSADDPVSPEVAPRIDALAALSRNVLE